MRSFVKWPIPRVLGRFRKAVDPMVTIPKRAREPYVRALLAIAAGIVVALLAFL